MRIVCLGLAPVAALWQPARGDDLPALLREFFIAARPDERDAARKAILAIPQLDHARLEAAIDKLTLWPDRPLDGDRLRVELGVEHRIVLELLVRLPRDYTPRRRWPLMIALHGSGSQAADIMSLMRRMLGDDAERFILIAPENIDGPGFAEPVDREMRPRELLIALRKRLRIDNDRVFVAGYSLGGHRAFLTAVLHGDCLAGVMPLAGALVLPGDNALVDLFLENVRPLPMLVVWGENDVEFGITPRNRPLRGLAKSLKLDRYEAIELPGEGHLGVVPPAASLKAWLGRTRERYPHTVHQAFRFAETSRAYWVRAQKLAGAPLPAGEVRAPVRAGEDPRKAMAEYLRKQVGVIDAVSRDQMIELETHRSTYVELLLHDDLIDLNRPITVFRHKKKTWAGIVPRDLGVTLDEAAREWDFQRLPRAKLIVPVGGKARPVVETGSSR